MPTKSYYESKKEHHTKKPVTYIIIIKSMYQNIKKSIYNDLSKKKKMKEIYM